MKGGRWRVVIVGWCCPANDGESPTALRVAARAFASEGSARHMTTLFLRRVASLRHAAGMCLVPALYAPDGTLRAALCEPFQARRGWHGQDAVPSLLWSHLAALGAA